MLFTVVTEKPVFLHIPTSTTATNTGYKNLIIINEDRILHRICAPSKRTNVDNLLAIQRKCPITLTIHLIKKHLYWSHYYLTKCPNA